MSDEGEFYYVTRGVETWGVQRKQRRAIVCVPRSVARVSVVGEKRFLKIGDSDQMLPEGDWWDALEDAEEDADQRVAKRRVWLIRELLACEEPVEVMAFRGAAD